MSASCATASWVIPIFSRRWRKARPNTCTFTGVILERTRAIDHERLLVYPQRDATQPLYSEPRSTDCGAAHRLRRWGWLGWRRYAAHKHSEPHAHSCTDWARVRYEQHNGLPGNIAILGRRGKRFAFHSHRQFHAAESTERIRCDGCHVDRRSILSSGAVRSAGSTSRAASRCARAHEFSTAADSGAFLCNAVGAGGEHWIWRRCACRDRRRTGPNDNAGVDGCSQCRDLQQPRDLGRNGLGATWTERFHYSGYSRNATAGAELDQYVHAEHVQHSHDRVLSIEHIAGTESGHNQRERHSCERRERFAALRCACEADAMDNLRCDACTCDVDHTGS